MIERTLVLIKPEGFEYRETIIKRLTNLGEFVYRKFYETSPDEKIAEHYREHNHSELYEWLVNYYLGQPLEVIVLQGEDIIKKVKDCVGYSDPSKAKKGTIRALSGDSLEQANKEKRPIKNLVHCSSDNESAQHELSVWLEKIVE